MQLMIDLDTETAPGLRFAAKMLLDIAAWRENGQLPNIPSKAAPNLPHAAPSTGMSDVPPPPPPPEDAAPLVPPPPPADVKATDIVSNVPAAPAPMSNATALASSAKAADSINAVSTATSSNAMLAAAAEFDKAGMPWDVRIHQKAKGQKKDGTWKLLKGIDPGVVEKVTAELATAKLPESAQGPLLFGSAAVPPPPASVPPPPPSLDIEIPAASAPPASDGNISAFRALLDKITAGTKAGKLNPIKVAEIVQSHGAPNIMALKGMGHLISDVSASIDAALLGLA